MKTKNLFEIDAFAIMTALGPELGEGNIWGWKIFKLNVAKPQ